MSWKIGQRVCFCRSVLSDSWFEQYPVLTTTFNYGNVVSFDDRSVCLSDGKRIFFVDNDFVYESFTEAKAGIYPKGCKDLTDRHGSM